MAGKRLEPTKSTTNVTPPAVSIDTSNNESCRESVREIVRSTLEAVQAKYGVVGLRRLSSAEICVPLREIPVEALFWRPEIPKTRSKIVTIRLHRLSLYPRALTQVSTGEGSEPGNRSPFCFWHMLTL